jgi:hypothetical protein
MLRRLGRYAMPLWLVAAPTAMAQRDSAVSVLTARDALLRGVKLVGVYDANSGEWINRALLRDTLGNETRTTPIGVAALSVLEPIAGLYIFEIRKEGYAPKRFRLRADTVWELLVGLEPNPLGDATRLPQVVTTAKRRIAEDLGQKSGFRERCALGVQCVGRQDLDKHPGGGFADFLDNTEGIHKFCKTPLSGKMLPGSEIPRCQVQMRPPASTGYCAPTWFVDGQEWQPLKDKRVDATAPGIASQAQIENFLHAGRIEGIEVYQSGAPRPSRFGVDPRSECGAIVIWTR